MIERVLYLVSCILYPTSERILSLVGKVCIICFVLFHAFSVAVYTVPREAKDPVAKFTIEKMLPQVTPYMLITSQWQLWNIFSPDPQRRVTYYRIEALTDDKWTQIEDIRTGTYSIWRHSTKFKLYSNLLDEFAQNRAPLVGRFMHLVCADHQLSAGTAVRLQYEHYVIPYHTKRESTAWWNAWKPVPESTIGYQTTCPL